MDSANNNIAATGKRKAGDINPAEANVNSGATAFVRGSLHQPPYPPQLAAVSAVASPKKGAASKKKSKPTDSAKAQARLEANRKAARESRRRKKVLVEELQRSVIFFSRANGQLKQKNEELERMFIQAQAQIAARNGATAAASSEGGQEVQEGVAGELETDDGGAAKTTADDEVNDTADVEDESTSADVPQGGDTLLATAGGDQEQTTTDAQPQQQQQQQEMTNIPFPSMVQQPIPFAAVPGGAAPAMDPNTMMYMMMMSGNPLAMAANPMMALQMFNQLNAAAAAAGTMAGGVQQPQVSTTTQGANAAAAAAAAAPTAFPAMPVGVGNVIMPTPGGAFNPFGGFPAAAAGTTNTEAATAATAEGDSPSAAADVKEEVNV